MPAIRDFDAVTFNDRCWRRLCKSHLINIYSVDQLALGAIFRISAVKFRTVTLWILFLLCSVKKA